MNLDKQAYPGSPFFYLHRLLRSQLFPLAKFEVLDIVFRWPSIHICFENMYVLFQLFFVLIDCSTILVPNFWYYWKYMSDKFSITVNGSSGWK